jgi:hypothetical protein
MPVTNQHQLYSDSLIDWRETRDCIKGNSAVKKRREVYLPKMSGQTAEDYDRYQKKVKFFGATGRALDGLHGNIFRKAPEQSAEISETFTKSLEDVDLAGTSLDQFASDVIYDCLQTNWGAVLVDYARGGDAVSLADAENQGLRAYLKYYPAESVINWDYKVVNGKMQLAFCVLTEPYTLPDPLDMFASTEYEKYRVLRLDRETGDYIQDIYDGRISLEKPVESIAVKMNGKALKTIPLFTVPGALPEKSMLYDLAQLNLQHYQDTADYQNGKHYTAIPTPIAIGLSPEYDDQGRPKPMFIGGTRFQYFPNTEHVTGADVKFLEFTGQGMKALADGINHLENQMAILGAHIIANEKRGVETAEALRIHRIGENGVLASFTRNISDQITKAVRLCAVWNGENETALDNWSINFNTDYDLTEENTQTLAVLLTGRAAGEIPVMSLYLGLKSLNLIPEQWDFEEFLAEREKDRKAVLEALPPDREPEDDDPDADQDDDEDDLDGEDDDQPPNPRRER